MGMTTEQATRYRAIQILEIAASTPGMTIAEINDAIDGEHHDAERLAILAMFDSIPWQRSWCTSELRAEAAARLREGWRP